MNKKELVKNLIKDIQDIYSIANRFEDPEQIHSIDIDLALSKVRNLYELLLSLNPKEIYTPENQKEEISTIIETVKKETKPKPKTEVIEEPKPESEPEIIKEEAEEIIEEIIKEPELIIETPSKEEIIVKEEIIQEENSDFIESKEAPPEIMADKFHSKKFIHDDFAKKNHQKDVSEKMQSKPINDINSAIGINDKFIFIRELFSGNKDHYHETIQVLNNFDTFQNALDFLNENFDWKLDDANFERLKELVRRKYS